MPFQAESINQLLSKVWNYFIYIDIEFLKSRPVIDTRLSEMWINRKGPLNAAFTLNYFMLWKMKRSQDNNDQYVTSLLLLILLYSRIHFRLMFVLQPDLFVIVYQIA